MKLLLPLILSSLLSPSHAVSESSVEKRGTCAFTSLTSALTNQPLCCDETLLEIFWTDISANIGLCCPIGQILLGFDCVIPPFPSPAPVCSGKGVCPQKYGNDLGIQYGHCYTLKSINGNWLGHDSGNDPGTKYITNGENPALVFRVCSDKPSCVANVNDYVPVNGTWYMQDQMGDPTSTGFGWLGGAGDLTVQDNSDNALALGGSTSCWDGQCAVCITFPPGGAAAPCPLPAGQAHLGIAANPNSCQAFYFQEVPCRSEK